MTREWRQLRPDVEWAIQQRFMALPAQEQAALLRAMAQGLMGQAGGVIRREAMERSGCGGILGRFGISRSCCRHCRNTGNERNRR